MSIKLDIGHRDRRLRDLVARPRDEQRLTFGQRPILVGTIEDRGEGARDAAADAGCDGRYGSRDSPAPGWNRDIAGAALERRQRVLNR